MAWHIRNNTELQSIYKDIDIVCSIKLKRIKWFKHYFNLETVDDGKKNDLLKILLDKFKFV